MLRLYSLAPMTTGNLARSFRLAAMPMAREGGRWKVAALAASALP
jgi:hypothetical protein